MSNAIPAGVVAAVLHQLSMVSAGALSSSCGRCVLALLEVPNHNMSCPLGSQALNLISWMHPHGCENSIVLLQNALGVVGLQSCTASACPDTEFFFGCERE
mmetsp:Transcript_12810/g.20264  ORF Transcript_12810/g.20264 Transcript_12810/m.20264 type:complete len:101 (-) Transcript_12810:59-361(-)